MVNDIVRYHPRNQGERFQLITERRGGWDEWSREYRAVVGVSFPDGTERMALRFDDTFEWYDGRQLVVEFPQRVHDRDITIECYEPEYEYVEVSIKEFNEAVEGGRIEVINQ